MVEPFLEEKTLEVCFEKKKIYIADLKYLGEIECTDGRKVSFCQVEKIFVLQQCV